MQTNITKPEDYENFVLDRLDNQIKHKSEMTFRERQFLNGVIRQQKPKKILELGIAAGSSTAVILNAIKDLDDSFLFSIDYNTNYYRDNTKLTGFIVDEVFTFNEIKNKWKLFTGGVAAKFIDNIGDEIDLCIIDTAHSNPGELLDFLMIMPYLNKNAVVIIHDIEYHTIHYSTLAATCSLLFSAIKGKKIIPTNSNWNFGFPNIGAVILDDNVKDNIFNIFKLLTLPWSYEPSEEDNKYIIDIFNKNYGSYYANLYQVISKQHSIFLNNNSNIIKQNETSNLVNDIAAIDCKLNKLVNTIAWWIPVKKWRNSFRKKFE